MKPIDESFAKFVEAHGHSGLPWQTPVDELRAIFTAGWLAHEETLRQTDLFSANEAQSDVRPLCKQEVAGSIPAVGSTITAEDIYAAYPRHIGKQAAIKAIKKAAMVVKLQQRTRFDPHEWLLGRVKSYSATVEQWPAADKQYIPHPATWFNRGSYDDDPKEWVRGAAATPSQFRSTQ